MRRTTEREMQSVLKLDGPARFEHFIKRVVDEERAWGLWDDGWALLANEDDTPVFPLWPAREYAELLREGAWAKYEPREIPLDDLMEALLPMLREKQTLPGVFPTPSGKGLTPTVDELEAALRQEREKYGE